mmetsp:Transcript_99253/g.236811  ORF Transcript_99253/g.236811 Transcript_99253/m.236811 type:complete len:216 (-) Transcript_99253:336-983(-)
MPKAVGNGDLQIWAHLHPTRPRCHFPYGLVVAFVCEVPEVRILLDGLHDKVDLATGQASRHLLGFLQPNTAQAPGLGDNLLHAPPLVDRRAPRELQLLVKAQLLEILPGEREQLQRRATFRDDRGDVRPLLGQRAAAEVVVVVQGGAFVLIAILILFDDGGFTGLDDKKALPFSASFDNTFARLEGHDSQGCSNPWQLALGELLLEQRDGTQEDQ